MNHIFSISLLPCREYGIQNLYVATSMLHPSRRRTYPVDEIVIPLAINTTIISGDKHYPVLVSSLDLSKTQMGLSLAEHKAL